MHTARRNDAVHISYRGGTCYYRMQHIGTTLYILVIVGVRVSYRTQHDGTTLYNLGELYLEHNHPDSAESCLERYFIGTRGIYRGIRWGMRRRPSPAGSVGPCDLMGRDHGAFF